jgi:ABC-type polysaccharide/polyol phosphate export permease
MISQLLHLAWYNWLCSQRRAMMQFIIYLQPVFTTALYAMANPYSDNAPGKAFWFVVINGSLLNIWGINVFATISDIHRDRWTGMLSATRLSVTPLLTVFIIRALTNTLHGAVSLAMFAAFAWVLYQPDWVMVLDGRVWALLAFAFTLIAVFSLLFATIIAMSPHSHHIMNFIEYPVFIIAGIGFTVGLLPTAMQWFALMLPFGYVAESARSIAGISLSSLAPFDVIWLPAFGGILIALIGLQQMKHMERKLAETGNVR